jgi:type I restriction enzyme S subunit
LTNRPLKIIINSFSITFLFDGHLMETKKQGWEIVKLGNVLNHRKGFIQIDDLEKYKLCRVQTSARGIVLRSEVFGSEIRTKKQQVCKAGDFLVAEIDAKMGGYGIVPEDLEGAIVSSHYFLYDIIEDKLDKTYLELFTQTPRFFEQVKAEGSTNYAAIRPSHVLTYEIPLPPLSEQQRIAGRLAALKGKIDAVRVLRGEQEKEMKGLLLMQYQRIIEGAEWKPLKEVAPLMRRKVDLQPNTVYSEIGVRSFGKGIFEKPSFNSDELSWEKPNWIKEGDLLMSNIKAWEGAVAAVGKEHDGKVGSHRYLSFAPHPEISSAKFLAFYFLTEVGNLKLSETSPGSADRNRTLNTKIILNTLVPVPDLELQKEFLQLQTKMEALKSAQVGQLSALEGLFPGVLEQAFRGEW